MPNKWDVIAAQFEKIGDLIARPDGEFQHESDWQRENEKLKSQLLDAVALIGRQRAALERREPAEPVEPVEIGKLLTNIEHATREYHVGGPHSGQWLKILEGAREAIVTAFQARTQNVQTDEPTPERTCESCAHDDVHYSAEPCKACCDDPSPVYPKWAPRDVAVEPVEEPTPQNYTVHVTVPEPPAAAVEPERQSGDVWCEKIPDATIRPDDPACGQMHGLRAPGQDPKVRGIPKIIKKCRDCGEMRVEPEAEEDTSERYCWTCLYHGCLPDDQPCKQCIDDVDQDSLSWSPRKPEEPEPDESDLPPISEEMRVLLYTTAHGGPVASGPASQELRAAIRTLEANQRPKPGPFWKKRFQEPCDSPGFAVMNAVVRYTSIETLEAAEAWDDLRSYVDRLEATQRPKSRDLGTSLQDAVAALPVTLRADATDAAQVLTMANESSLALRLLVSVAAEVLDPTATCGDCLRLCFIGKTECLNHCELRDISKGPTSTACVRIQPKPPEASETEPVKARFFTRDRNDSAKWAPLWAFTGTVKPYFFSQYGDGYMCNERDTIEILEKMVEDGRATEILEPQIREALDGRPKATAKLDELLAEGHDDATN